jgi:hypothetical protein
MKLYNAKSTGQPDSAAPGSRGEEELEDARAMFGSDAVAGIGHAHLGHLAAPVERHGELPAIGHGLDRVEHEVEDGLLDELPVKDAPVGCRRATA